MTRTIPTVVLNALEDEVVVPFYAVELMFDDDGALRLWTGVGDLDHDGHIWTGGGNLLNISEVQEANDLSARGAVLTLSGLPSEILSLALTQPYQGRVANIYFGVRTHETAFTEVFSGFMDQMNLSEGPDSGSLEITIENKLIDLERARIARYTSAYQKLKFPNDKGLDFIEDLQDKNIVWGRSPK